MSNFFIDGTRPDDTGAGTAEATAKKTLAAGLALATTAGDVVNVKDSATYTLAAAVAPGIAGVTLRGYHATIGDRGGRPLITSATNSVDLVNVQASSLLFDHLAFSHTAGTRGKGLVAKAANRANIWLNDCTFDGLRYAVDGEWSTDFTFTLLRITGCEFKNSTSHAIVNGGGTILADSVIRDNTGDAWKFGSFNGPNLLSLSGCVIVRNGAGLHYNAAVAADIVARRCVFHSNASHGIALDSPGALNHLLNLTGNVFYGNTGYGISAAGTVAQSYQQANAFGANTTGARTATVPAGSGDVTLTADPATNAAGNDFSPNNTPGGGALLRAAGWPATLPGLSGTSYPDIGTYQHAAAAGGFRRVTMDGGF
jgi:hypothetical protein